MTITFRGLIYIVTTEAELVAFCRWAQQQAA